MRQVTVTTLLLLLVLGMASVWAQAPCNLHEAEVRRTSERCCRCIEADNCNGGGELEAELFPGYNCNEVDYDYDESSCRLEGLDTAPLRHVNIEVACLDKPSKPRCRQGSYELGMGW